MPWRKLLGPSRGSMIQRGFVGSPSIVPPSSSTKPQSGRAWRNSSHNVRSAAWSALETKSEGPLRLTWRCSTSPKSRRSRPPALRAARSITRISPDTAATIYFLSVECDTDGGGRNLDLPPSARELEVPPIPRHGINDAVVRRLVPVRARLVDLQVFDVRKTDEAAAIAALFTGLRRHVLGMELGEPEVHLQRQRFIVIDDSEQIAPLEVDALEA